ncbi:hypothetical protein [Halorubrum laminariae]|uniref:Uncharacterized protein n=1 Tax=Halorubrum laminariae TaxID=1433523 RepID=A0ABD6BZF7_9EURY|nr:hypothetical protein [Halorubrum laminariae]
MPAGKWLSKDRTIVDPQRFISLVVLALIVIALDLAGIDVLVGVDTVSDAVAPFLGITVGGYLGLTLSDVVWNRLFASGD